MAKVLLVDDDPQVRTTLGEFITKAGHELVTADSGKSAMAIMKTEPVDLLVIDIIMPDQDGIETILALAGSGSRPKIIAISGGSQRFGLDFVVEIARKLPVDDVLIKPVSYEGLCASMDGVLGLDAPA